MAAQPSADIEALASDGDVLAQLELARRLDAEGKTDDALDWLRRAASTGDPAARAALGRNLVKNAKTVAEESQGVTIFVSAAQDGSGEAAYFVANIAGSGLDMPQNWTTALTYLQRSAELGYDPARAELALLAGDRALADAALKDKKAPADLWRRLRESIDLAAWLAPARSRVVNVNPRIAVLEGFASDALCDWMIAKARPLLAPAAAQGSSNGSEQRKSDNDYGAAYFRQLEFNFPLLLLRQRIADATRLPLPGLEATAVLHYAAGQTYAAHCDYLDPNLPEHEKLIAKEGQRVATFLIYLNDDFDGGETEFPRIPWRHKGKKGDAVFWWNVQQNGSPEPKTLHAGLPPAKGEKWVLSQWISVRGVPQPPKQQR